MSLEDKAEKALKALDELDRVADEVIARKAASAGLSIEDWKLKVQQKYYMQASSKRPQQSKHSEDREL